MKKLLSLALFSAVVCMSSTNFAVAQNPLSSYQQELISRIEVQSTNNFDNTGNVPAGDFPGNYLATSENKTIINGPMLLLVGEKNKDTGYKFKHYAKFDVAKNTELQLNEGTALKIQVDGKLINNGKVILNDKSELIAPPITLYERRDFTSDKRLKHGIDNRNGTILVNKGSKIYWQEDDNNDDTKGRATIYQGILDFEDFFANPDDMPDPQDFLVTLEGVKIKLFDPTTVTITKEILDNTHTFEQIVLGENCELLDYEAGYGLSGVYKLPEDFYVDNRGKRQKVFSKDTIVRGNANTSGVTLDALQGLFNDSSKKLTNKQKPKPDSQSSANNYSLRDLVDEFNKEGERTIIDTRYTKRVNLLIRSNNNEFSVPLTSDWESTIDKGIFPLSSEQFTDVNDKKVFDMHFTFAGDKNLSFALQNVESDFDKYKIVFHGDLSNYNQTINNEITKYTNIVNNFTQKYVGASPVLQTNEKTEYEVLTGSNNEGVTLRLVNDNRKNACMNRLIVKDRSKFNIDCTYDESDIPNYAQNIALKHLEVTGGATVILRAGQTVTIGSYTPKYIPEEELRDDPEDITGGQITNGEDDDFD